MNKPIPFGKYYLLDRVNVGGMAEVFRAKAFGVEGFERVVAVKRILPSIAEDTDFITMFVDEAKLAVQLTHANIAQIFDLGKVGDAYFIALEYVHGKDLRALFDRAHKRGEGLPAPMAAYVMMKVCEGLDYAHNKRDGSGRPLDLVHRDVSPPNILVSFDGEVKIIDFGIAKAAGKAGKTQAGILKGKFGYLSPEQARGEHIDRRSDVFAVGICLYELLTGERLFAGESDFSSLEKVRSAEIPEPRRINAEIPEELQRIVLTALSRDLDARYATAMDLHDDLQSFLHSAGYHFGRKDLSAWMRARFEDEAERPMRLAGSTEPEGTEVIETIEPMEPADVELHTVSKNKDGDRAAANVSQPGVGASKPKGTILGMPAAPPPAAGAAGRSVPPPPPRGRTAPPPPPKRSTTPPAPPGSGPSAPPARARGTTPPPPPQQSVSGTQPPAGSHPPAASAPPPPQTNPAQTAASAGRSVPPPPQSSIPPRLPSEQAAPLSAQAEQSARSPVLDMDWDDEELSTQIYDRPEGASMDFGLLGESQSGAARNIPTYVPPGAPGEAPVAPAPGPSSLDVQPPSVSPATPVTSSREPTLTPAVDSTADVGLGQQKSNAPLLAAVALLAVAVIGFGIYTLTASGDPGVLQLTTKPGDASVVFDSQPVQGSSSPYLVTSIEPGTPHLLEVSKPGYEPWSQAVQVSPGQRLEFSVTLEPSTPGAVAPPAAGSQGPDVPFDPKLTGFSIESSPPGANVYLNGSKLNGVTPMRVTGLAPGAYKLRLELDGYKPVHESTVDVRANEVQALPKFVMVGEPVSVTFESTPPGAKVRLVRGDESRSLGTTPLTSMVDPSGEAWTVEMSADGFETYTNTLSLPAGQPEARFTAKLDKRRARPGRRAARRSPARRPAQASAPSPSPAPAAAGSGTLRVNSRPWSKVHVDGRLVGNTPQMNVRLSAGRHKLMLVNPEFGVRKTVTVDIEAGQTTTKIVNLK